MHSNIASRCNQAGRLLIPILTAGVLLTTATVVKADRGWLSDWQSLYPTSLSDDNASCALCHTSIDTNGSLNAYGSAVRGGITDAESADSDGQGDSNIVEIRANTQPGWTGSAPTGVIGDLDPTTVVANIVPTADPGGPYTASVGESIQFNNGSFDPDGDIDSYAWVFGDGGTSTSVNPTHAYAAAGTYTVALTVTDNDGATDRATTTATIISVTTTAPPIADAGGPYEGTADVSVAFNGTGSFDPDGGAIASYDWDFGDGNTASGATPNHTYTATGIYDVTLIVTDDEGETGRADTTASIGTGDLPPIADAGGTYTADIGETVTFDATGSSGSIVSYNWEFGDDSFLIDGGATPSHSYSTAGIFNVILTVIDDVNLTDTDTVQVIVVDPLDVPVVDEGDDEERDDYDRDDYDRDDDDRDDDDRDDDDRDDDERDYDYRDRDYDRD